MSRITDRVQFAMEILAEFDDEFTGLGGDGLLEIDDEADRAALEKLIAVCGAVVDSHGHLIGNHTHSVPPEMADMDLEYVVYMMHRIASHTASGERHGLTYPSIVRNVQSWANSALRARLSYALTETFAPQVDSASGKRTEDET